MTESITVKRIRGGSLIKLIFFGSVIGLTLLCAVLSIPAFFGVEILTWNGGPITGSNAIFGGPLLGLFLGAFFGTFVGLFAYLGLRIYSLFRPITIEYVPYEKD